MTRFLRLVLSGLGLLALPWEVFAATPTQGFQVSAQVVAGCAVDSSDYGRVDYGSVPSTSGSTLSTALSSMLRLQCTPGVALLMKVDGGKYGRKLQREGGSEQIAYQLFTNAAMTSSLGIGQAISVPYTDATNISLPIYGQVRLPGNMPAGTYSDVLQIELSW